MELSVKILGLSALLMSIVFLVSCGSNSSASADVVARVNNTTIATSQLEKQFQSRLTGAEQQPASPEEAEDLKLQVLNQMINDQILLEMASSAGLSATDAEV